MGLLIHLCFTSEIGEILGYNGLYYVLGLLQSLIQLCP